MHKMTEFIFSIVALLLTVEFVNSGLSQPPDKVLFISAKIISKKTVHGHFVKNRKVFKDLKFIDQHNFGDVEDLKVLKTEIRQLYEGAVKSLPQLRELRLAHCGITTIHPKAFKNLPKLIGLHLNNNRLEEIRRNVFNYLPIRALFLQRNFIRIIEPGALDHLPNLELIQMNSNRIAEWSGDWFRNVPKLINVHFRRNKIAEIPARAFANIKGSHSINGVHLYDTNIFLSKNNIESLDPRAFEGLEGANGLWLDRNRLETLPDKLFAHMNELNALYLGKNKLRSIEKGLLATGRIAEMGTLEVSKNRIECLPYEIVALVKHTYVDGNRMDCNCLGNLREKLREANSANTVEEGEDRC